MIGAEIGVQIQQPDFVTVLAVALPIVILCIFLCKINSIFTIK